MSKIKPIELFGYFGSVLVALSLMFEDIFWLRIVNLTGAVVFVIYGGIIKSYPVVALNAFVCVVNIYHLYKLLIN